MSRPRRSTRKTRGLTTIAAVLAIHLSGPALADSDTITTAQIMSRTVSAAPSCAAWRVSGVCFWLRCTLWSCSVKTSIRISHYVPEAVVSTFHDENTHPWVDYGRPLAKQLLKAAQSQLRLPTDSSGTRTRDDRRDRNKLYRDLDVIGHPTGLLLSMAGGGSSFSALCPTDVSAFKPFLSSYLDAMVWRAVLPVEALYLEAWIPGMREIGQWPLNSWSGLYPRDGNVVQQHPVKGAAVLAQRAGDVTTRTGQPHVYEPLPTGGLRIVNGTLVWLPPPLVERDASTGAWQMLAPVEQQACEVFGQNDSALLKSWGDGKTSSTGGHVFNLWRPYSCCSQEGQFFLGYAGL
jgi:integrating conjugative element protein (TIGR03756 family)